MDKDDKYPINTANAGDAALATRVGTMSVMVAEDSAWFGASRGMGFYGWPVMLLGLRRE